jgi:hypothetical protein
MAVRMSHATAQRRSRDGLIEIVPNTVRLTRAERYALMFGIVLSSGGVYLSALIPPQLFALVVGCCLAAELAVVLQEAGVMQPPKAPVHVLGGWRASGR